MLYLISTAPDGRVIEMTACDDGIDEALKLAAARLTHPEEDEAATLDVVAERWHDAVAIADELGVAAESVFVIDRPRFTPLRFGLVVASEVTA